MLLLVLITPWTLFLSTIVPLDDNGDAADRRPLVVPLLVVIFEMLFRPQDVAGDGRDDSRLIDNAERCIGGRGGHAKSRDRVVLDDRVDRAISEHDACVVSRR